MMEARFDWDGGEMWGVDLNGPFMFACPITRQAVANRPAGQGYFGLVNQMEGVYAGVLPSGPGVLIGNTASEIYEIVWGMMTWSFVQSILPDTARVVGIMAHELFHAWQRELFTGQRPHSPPLHHMDELEERISIWIEIAALLHALETSGEERQQAVHTALSARAARHERNPDAVPTEAVYEISEGTAVYTEMRVIMNDMTEKIPWMEAYIDTHYAGKTLQLIGYVTGALYGFLLDAFEVDWTRGLRWGTDLGALLKEAAGIENLTPFEELDLTRYNYESIRATETVWAANNTRRVNAIYALFEHPALRLPMDGDFISDDGGIHAYDLLFLPGIGDYVAAYCGNIEYAGAFGRVVITGGQFIIGRTMGFWEITAHGMELTETGAATSYWVLELNRGWRIAEDGGNFVIRR
jgi:hypothetical protein